MTVPSHHHETGMPASADGSGRPGAGLAGTPFVLTDAAGWVGRELGVTGWRRIDQPAVDAYADLTGDRDWLHNDPERARQHSPFEGRTIVQGSFLLAHCVRFLEEVAPPEGLGYALNYGFDRVRFVRPVRVGSRVRGRFTLHEVRPRPGDAPGRDGRIVLGYDVAIETDDAEGPAVVARWLGLAQPADTGDEATR
ncbi:MaoC/PaaZ C-terminal domain-containing protein [Embleya sp. NPDC056575]|uniref:MaoC/PaaZ C-terminal domain-containing protein n=1 Tax=unclassified Embleya TaxID=2699296 RepID=UPI003698D884